MLPPVFPSSPQSCRAKGRRKETSAGNCPHAAKWAPSPCTPCRVGTSSPPAGSHAPPMPEAQIPWGIPRDRGTSPSPPARWAQVLLSAASEREARARVPNIPRLRVPCRRSCSQSPSAHTRPPSRNRPSHNNNPYNAGRHPPILPLSLPSGAGTRDCVPASCARCAVNIPCGR